MTDYLHCPLCGFEFKKRDIACTRGCLLRRFCNLVQCPHCRYEFAEQTRPVKSLHGLFHRPQSVLAQPDSIPLPELAEGEQSELVCLNCTHTSRRNALAVYGLVPGSRVILRQKRPAFVIRVGEIELALGSEVACQIFVKRLSRVSV
jgi:Fe2+ transport system protein FeoA